MKRRSQGAAFSLFAFQDIITSICGIVVLITLMLSLELSLRVLAEASGNDALQSKQKYDEIKTTIEVMKQNIAETQAQIEAVNAAAPTDTLEQTTAQLEDANARLAVTIAGNQQRLDELTRTLKQSEARLHKARLLEVDIDRMSKEKTRLVQQQQDLTRQAKQLDATAQSIEKRKGLYYGKSVDPNRRPWLADVQGDKIIARSLSADGQDPDLIFKGGEKKLVKDFSIWCKELNISTEYVLFVIRPSGHSVYNELKGTLPRGLRYGIDLIGEEQPVNVAL